MINNITINSTISPTSKSIGMVTFEITASCIAQGFMESSIYFVVTQGKMKLVTLAMAGGAHFVSCAFGKIADELTKGPDGETPSFTNVLAVTAARAVGNALKYSINYATLGKDGPIMYHALAGAVNGALYGFEGKISSTLPKSVDAFSPALIESFEVLLKNQLSVANGGYVSDGLQMGFVIAGIGRVYGALPSATDVLTATYNTLPSEEGIIGVIEHYILDNIPGDGNEL